MSRPFQVFNAKTQLTCEWDWVVLHHRPVQVKLLPSSVPWHFDPIRPKGCSPLFILPVSSTHESGCLVLRDALAFITGGSGLVKASFFGLDLDDLHHCIALHLALASYHHSSDMHCLFLGSSGCLLIPATAVWVVTRKIQEKLNIQVILLN